MGLLIYIFEAIFHLVIKLKLLWSNPYALLNAKVLLEFDTKKQIRAQETVQFANCLLYKPEEWVWALDSI